MKKSPQEIIAEFQHQLWSNWIKYQFENANAENLCRWFKQSQTPYKELSEKEKNSDRKIARELLEYFWSQYHK